LLESSQPLKKKPKLGKNPNVDTSFLPDRDREEEERKEREHLRLEWLQKQEEIKSLCLFEFFYLIFVLDNNIC